MLPASSELPVSGEAVGVCFGSITKLSAVATSDSHVEKSCKFTSWLVRVVQLVAPKVIEATVEAALLVHS